MIPYSILDLSPIVEGGDAAQSFANTLDLAQHAERWGYTRYWLAEHHNMPGIASAATSVVIAHVAAGTKTIRLGSGGVMLPNHSPLVIAEQFGTLATLHPGRIDLGLGRAPGTDMATARALRRGKDHGDRFPEDVIKLMAYLSTEGAEGRVQAVPGRGTEVPVWILGSSLYGAQLAAHLGLPYAFASHFAPAALEEAVEVYRRGYRPSAANPAPHFMLAANVWGAETREEALRLKTSQQQAFARLRFGTPGPLPRPVDDIDAAIEPAARAMVDQALSVSATGTREEVAADLSALIARYAPDEIILASAIHDHKARLRSFEIAAEAMQTLSPAAAAE